MAQSSWTKSARYRNRSRSSSWKSSRIAHFLRLEAVIAATNRTLRDIRNKGIFRDDFFYRFSSDIITVPPLRQRLQEDPGELDDLLTHTVERMVGKPYPELVQMVREVTDRQLGPTYPWPGNVRELEQCVRRVLLKRNYRGDVKQDTDDIQTFMVRAMENGEADADQLLAGYCRMLYDRHGTYEMVARRTRLDRRTVKKYISKWNPSPKAPRT